MRLSAAETIAALQHLGFTPVGTDALRQWRHRGYLSPGRGYEPHEVAAYLVERVQRMDARHNRPT